MHTTVRTASAMLMVLDQAMSPYAAAKQAGINLTTMYKSRLYKQYRAGDLDTLRKELVRICAQHKDAENKS